jgi:hypothetical protein
MIFFINIFEQSLTDYCKTKKYSRTWIGFSKTFFLFRKNSNMGTSSWTYFINFCSKMANYAKYFTAEIKIRTSLSK